MGKVNRNNHPILVKARKASYEAGKSDGFKIGYTKGFEKGKEKGMHIAIKPYLAEIECLKTIIAGFEAKEEQNGRCTMDKNPN